MNKVTNNINRRNFLGLTIAGSSAVFLSARVNVRDVLAQTVRVRPNIADLLPNSPQLNALKAGVEAMKKLPDTDFRNWTRQAKIHDDFCPHGNWFFLPWHRAYLYYFEQICRQASGSPDFMLPYWDWTTSPRLPASFWGEDNPLMNTTRQNTPNSEARAENVGQNVINSILAIKDFYTFGSGFATEQRPPQPRRTGQLEGTPHNYIHGSFIRGNMGSFMSPLDPIFWLHHANIDRLWGRWIRQNPGRMPNDPVWLDFEVGTFFDLQGSQVKKKVSALLDNYDLGYRYPDQPEKAFKIGKLTNLKENAPLGLFVKSNINGIARTDESLTVDVPETPETLDKAIEKIAATDLKSNASLPTLRLTVELDKPGNSQTSVRVFINAPDTESELSVDSPSYVGTINFFEMSHNHSDMTGDSSTMNTTADERTFLLDATKTIQKLSKSKLFGSLQDAKVSIVPVLTGDVSDATPAQINLNGFQFEIIK